MKRLLLIGFAACAFALAPTLPASAMPVAKQQTMVTNTDSDASRFEAIVADGATTTAGAGDAIAAIVNHAPESRGRLSWRSLSFIQSVADSREITPYLWVHPDEER